MVLHSNQFLHVPSIVGQIIISPSFWHASWIHVKNGNFCAIFDMNCVINFQHSSRNREIIGDSTLNGIPVIVEDAEVVIQHVTWDGLDVSHDVFAIIFSVYHVLGQRLHASVPECWNLRHIWIVKYVESFRYYVHVSALNKWSDVWISNKWSLEIKLLITKLYIFLEQCVSVPWNIFSSIALTSYVEVTPLELRVLFKEISEKGYELVRWLVHVIGMFFTIWETSTDRLINENEMYDFIPGAFRVKVNLVIIRACACPLDP